MKISAIVPVYNTEDLVGRCIESILSQSFLDWELILIDDGSKDGSLSVLKSYEMNDSRIKVIHQDNSGPGLARNRGIKEATGEYVVFIDSDDYIAPHYFERLSNEKADVVFIDVERIDSRKQLLAKEYMSKYRSFSKDCMLRNQLTGNILWGGVRKAVKRELIEKYNIYYSNNAIGEEAIFSFLVLYYAETYSFIDEVVYYYVDNIDSLTHSINLDPWGKMAIELRNELCLRGIYENYVDSVNALITTSAIISLKNIAISKNWRNYRIEAIKRIESFNNDLDLEYAIDFKHMKTEAIILYLLLRFKRINTMYLICNAYQSFQIIMKGCN